MANGRNSDKIIGSFTEKDHGNRFEFKLVECPVWEKQRCTHEVAVGGVHGNHYRGARVFKTVAYIAVGEDVYGLVWEKWNIKNHTLFAAA